jgi:tellurite methyltransferase
MSGDRARWDGKYAASADADLEPPEPMLLEVLDDLTPGGRALDLAAGTGRHALELARRGYQVEAWDVSPVGLAILTREASVRGLEIETRTLDLVDGGLPPDGPLFELVVVTRFLDRPLFSKLHRLLVPGGHLVLLTFNVDWPGERPGPRFRLRPGELEAGLPGLETVNHGECAGLTRWVGVRSPPGG